MPNPSWTSTGAGYAGANGNWTAAGTNDGKPYYNNASGWFLFWSTEGNGWYIGPMLADIDYVWYYIYEPDLPGNPWLYTGYGPSPAPTVTAWVGGGGHNISGFVGNCTHSLPPGAAMAGVTIDLTGDATGSMVTAADGLWEFAGLADGNYHLEATKTDYEFVPDPAGMDVVLAGADLGLYYFYGYYQPEAGGQALIRKGFAWQFGGEDDAL